MIAKGVGCCNIDASLVGGTIGDDDAVLFSTTAFGVEVTAVMLIAVGRDDGSVVTEADATLFWRSCCFCCVDVDDIVIASAVKI